MSWGKFIATVGLFGAYKAIKLSAWGKHFHDNNISLDFTHNIICMSMHTNIFNVTSDATIRFKADLFLYDL